MCVWFLKWQVVVGGKEDINHVVDRWLGGRLANLQSLSAHIASPPPCSHPP